MAHTPTSSRPARPPQAGRWRLATYSALVYAFLYAPILVLVVFSFNSARSAALWQGFTVQPYTDLLHDHRLQEAAMNSLLVAAAATAAAVVVGTMAALGLWGYTFRGQAAGGISAATRGLLFLPVIIPEVVTGAALLVLFAGVGAEFGMSTVILTHVGFCVSYVAIVVRARLAGLDRSLLEAAADLGAGPAGAFFRVTLPLIAPGVLAAGLLAFTISLDDYVVTSFVAGPGATTLPLWIASKIHTGITPEVNATCTVLLIFTAGPILLAQRLLRQPSDVASKPEGKSNP